MTTFLGYNSQWLTEHNGIHTAKEISHQPALWHNLAQILDSQAIHWQAFLQPLLADPKLRIILIGAGTSAFVGDAVAPFIQTNNRFNVASIPTTDLVSNPAEYLDPSRKTLVVSFARSGNSPESVAAVELVDQLVENSYHLFLTCNPDGKLSRHANSHDNAFCLHMPDGSNDQSFAMTSSFSCMLMSAISIFGSESPEQRNANIAKVATLCEGKISEWQDTVKTLAAQPYQRLITLGSGGLAGVAREASLKSLELSAGKVMTAFDSSLGFRHGPKFTINEQAVVIQYLSNNPYTRQYDLDLYNEIQNDNQVGIHIALSGSRCDGEHVFELGQPELSDSWLCFPYIVFSQMLAFEKSLQLGLGPDNPCPTGEVNRVVQGVNIHPYSL
ncbi:SIS domain-containing protein [Photobacterium sp. ZSDE20]|uniref:SIS domain-containing protein n=1 Tax=Photobacterium pectinilyticum TaxID=2906793 RepID=A0ABT1N7I1_9GAMM|nr:SIS domain-containing protein [Photobacterium sp. ZSDE20]MCQ1060712.1 SIS domain-containing protein [Photobacterium sp. ZSDE20]MDD1824094.1 SIS domain-containing protein [Photobacterium sp. ZSDE20]